MKKTILNIENIRLDPTGRVELGDEDLERLEKSQDLIVAGGTNLICTGTNSQCSNGGWCRGSTSNDYCSNGGSCGGSTNENCDTPYPPAQ